MKRPLIIVLVLLVFCAVIILAAWLADRHVYDVDVPITAAPTDCDLNTGGPGMRFAVIGDYGQAGQPEAEVAALIDRWGGRGDRDRGR